jgi:alkanesulfonate monooxygenase SsuD/methylene tetrahydromethanopterin reductase-like flavin-dependent oxidoreductase (luciferase family)
MEMRRRPLHFGVQLQAQRTSWSSYISAVRAAEELGYGSVWTFDHMLPFAGADDGGCFETLTTLGAMALVTERVRIGALVNGVLYRHPAILAKAAAQVDEMTGGRLEFTLGAAWAEREFRSFGLEFPNLSERYQRLAEALELVKLLWTQPRATFHGHYYRLEGAACEPKPVQSPHPPITIGGTGLGSLQVAAKHASRLNIVGSPAKCAERAAKLRELCTEIGRDFADIELSSHPTLVLAESRGEAEAAAQRVSANNWTDLEPVRDGWLIGTPDDIVEGLRRYVDVGVTHFVFAIAPPFDLGALQLMQAEVLPAFA